MAGKGHNKQPDGMPLVVDYMLTVNKKLQDTWELSITKMQEKLEGNEKFS